MTTTHTTRSAPPESEAPPTEIMAAIRRHWGFTSLRPLQAAAMRAVLDGRDSLLVLPTGGGKSLCYQAPALLRPEPTIVVSPLIALMKDQVDSLRSCGVSAVQLNSSQGPDEQRECERWILSGEVRLVFVSPERMATPTFRRLLSQLRARTFAIDEAHCISHWGHDFRPEYRMLCEIKSQFPDAAVHAFTATATKSVRDDIVKQLALHDAAVLVGNFDRPNLTYRVTRREDVLGQVLECVARHPAEAGIVYCIRRRDVDALAPQLSAAGVRAMPYHAGMTPPARHKTQNAFANEKCDVVVATVAFGMGIDRSNVRFVVHAGMPKSIEHYQQETGRAGRDGLEAECLLLFGGEDPPLWRSLAEKSVTEAEAAGQEVDPRYLQNVIGHINDMENFCRPVKCRHRALVEYFGQQYPAATCEACDVCLGDRVPVPDGQTIAKKILSCVARVRESFGVRHVIEVLRGAKTKGVITHGHERLSTYGLLKENRAEDVRDWIHQLVGQDALVVAPVRDDNPLMVVLKLNETSWRVMRDEQAVSLYFTGEASLAGESDGALDDARRERRRKSGRVSRADVDSWEGVNSALFEELRVVRRELADAKGMPPFVIVDDVTLRDLARVRPTTDASLRRVFGMGETRRANYGPAFMAAIAAFCKRHGETSDVIEHDRAAMGDESGTRRPSKGAQDQAIELFREGESVPDVAAKLLRNPRTVVDYLCEYIRRDKPHSIARWVDEPTYTRVATAARQDDSGRLKPIFDALSGEVPYEQIAPVVAHLKSVHER